MAGHKNDMKFDDEKCHYRTVDSIVRPDCMFSLRTTVFIELSSNATVHQDICVASATIHYFEYIFRSQLSYL